MPKIKHIHHYQFDISNPSHAKCFIIASRHYLSDGCDLDGQELYNALETGDDGETYVYFVLGNEPGVAVNDFGGKESAAVDKVTSEVYFHFN